MQQHDTLLTWSPPPDDLQLQSHRVDIWRVHLDLPPDPAKRLESTLSSDEAEHAARFHFEKDRSRFILAHGCLRDILARYVRCDPLALKFSTNEYGKPMLVSDSNLEFNLSHSGRYALVAVVLGRRVGIDVENIRRDIELENLARRFFSPGEVAELFSLPAEQRIPAFYNCWTRKEAYIKARGLGLSLPLDVFDVSLSPDEPVILRATRPDSAEADRWILHALAVDREYAGALAVERLSITAVRDSTLEFRYWGWNLTVD